MRKIIYSKLYSKTPLVKKTPYKKRTRNLNLHKNPTFKNGMKFADIRCQLAVQGSQFLHILRVSQPDKTSLQTVKRASWGAQVLQTKLYPQQLATSWIVGVFFPTHLKNMRPSNWIISPIFRGKKNKYLEPPSKTCNIYLVGAQPLVATLSFPQPRYVFSTRDSLWLVNIFSRYGKTPIGHTCNLWKRVEIEIMLTPCNWPREKYA